MYTQPSQYKLYFYSLLGQVIILLILTVPFIYFKIESQVWKDVSTVLCGILSALLAVLTFMIAKVRISVLKKQGESYIRHVVILCVVEILSILILLSIISPLVFPV